LAAYKVKFLGTDGYEGIESGWYGDCIIIYNSESMIVYDCGSEQHAERVIDFAESEFFSNEEFQMDVILSHNDKDHFDGILKLIDSGKVRNIYTTLLLKYVDEILEKLDDGKRNRESTKKHILELYDNIAQLSGIASLKDVYEDGLDLPEGIELIGPELDTMIDSAVKAIEENDISHVDGSETLVNSTSLQFKIAVEGEKGLLLVADAAPENIVSDLNDYDYIQLPHHGKLASAEAVFNKIRLANLSSITFIVSDNTGTSNGGSNDLMSSKVRYGKVIENTKDGDVELKAVLHATRSHAIMKNRGI